MGSQSIASRPILSIILCGLFVGLLAAALLSLGSDGGGISSAPAGGTTPVTISATRKTFSPSVAALAFAISAPLGGLIGMLWNRRGAARKVALILLVLLAGVAGSACAGIVGSQTRITVSAHSVERLDGAPLPVIVAGGVIGILLALACAWAASRRFPAGPGPASLTA
jgi:hypothetical protein